MKQRVMRLYCVILGSSILMPLLVGFGKRKNPVSTSFPNGEGEHNFDGFDNIYVSYTVEQMTFGDYSIR